MVTHNSINVLRYDEVVRALTKHPDDTFENIATATGVPISIIRKIWDGSIVRPATVVLERLKKPRRCPECRCLCVDWPCIVCEIQRRRGRKHGENVSFVYRRGPR